MERQILHIDVNNAFLSWAALERLKNGETLDIRTIPAIIGGDERMRSGIVLAKSMKAKECGVITGETIYSAKKKCPNLKVYQCDYSIYKKYSNQLYNLLLEYTDKIERYSIDECFLDMTNYLMKDTLLNKAREISKRVKNELKFTVNVGVANNKLLAKMASDFTKPDKVHTLYKEEIPTKMWPLPVGNLFMLGKKTVPKLNNMGIKTIGDLAKIDSKILINKFGKHGMLIWNYANGIDNQEVQYKIEKPKSIGNSITLPEDISNKEQIKEILLSLTEQVSYRLRKQDLIANVINVQLRTKDFQDFSHQKKLDFATSSTKILYQYVKELLDEMLKNKNIWIRLVGVKVDNLVDKNSGQLSLFTRPNNEKQEKIDKVMDAIKEKYGYDTIKRVGEMNVKNIVEPKRKK